MFTLNKDAILKHDRTSFLTDVLDIKQYLTEIEEGINQCYEETGYKPVQSGRVIALRSTDAERLSSAFKASIYLGKYQDMNNTERFLKNMVSAGHSYEPIRGENILFLFVGVSKPVYDHLTTYSVGRSTRIAGGQRANLPWGFEVPVETKGDTQGFAEAGMAAVAEIVNNVKGYGETQKQQIQAARSLLPVGYIMPPFLLEFSEEALIKNIFTQRIFERGAQGATVDVVKDMWNAVQLIDEEKWNHLLDYHGPHIQAWKKAMRTLRDKELSFSDLLSDAVKKGIIPDEEQIDMTKINVYDVLMKTVGKLPPNMWEKQK